MIMFMYYVYVVHVHIGDYVMWEGEYLLRGNDRCTTYYYHMVSYDNMKSALFLF